MVKECTQKAIMEYSGAPNKYSGKSLTTLSVIMYIFLTFSMSYDERSFKNNSVYNLRGQLGIPDLSQYFSSMLKRNHCIPLRGFFP